MRVAHQDKDGLFGAVEHLRESVHVVVSIDVPSQIINYECERSQSG